MIATVFALKCGFCERELKTEYVGHARSHRYYRFDENLQGYVQQWIEEGSLAVFDSVKQAEEERLRALQARASARDHE